MQRQPRISSASTQVIIAFCVIGFIIFLTVPRFTIQYNQGDTEQQRQLPHTDETQTVEPHSAPPPLPPSPLPLPPPPAQSKNRVAICLSGSLRVFRQTYKSWFSFLIDVYGHNTTFDFFLWVGLFIDEPRFKEVTAAEVLEVYKPVRYGFDEYKTYKERYMSQLHRIAKCFKLVADYEEEHNFKYDLVIRTRSDMILLAHFNLTPFIGTCTNCIFARVEFKHWSLNFEQYVALAKEEIKSGVVSLQHGEQIFAWDTFYAMDSAAIRGFIHLTEWNSTRGELVTPESISAAFCFMYNITGHRPSFASHNSINSLSFVFRNSYGNRDYCHPCVLPHLLHCIRHDVVLDIDDLTRNQCGLDPANPIAWVPKWIYIYADEKEIRKPQ